MVLVAFFKMMGKYSKDDFIKMEWKVLGILGFNVTYPVATEFVDHLMDTVLKKSPFLQKKEAKVSLAVSLW